MFSNNDIWKQVQEYLPVENRISDDNMPSEKRVSFHDIEIRYDEYLPKEASNVSIIIFMESVEMVDFFHLLRCRL